MAVFHNNPVSMEKFVSAEKTQIQNFWRVIAEPHISDNFREGQIEKLKQLGLDINDLGQDNHTALYSAINIYLNTYLNKYQLIANNPSNQNISLFQTQMDKYYKIIENLVKFGANPSVEANNILNLLVQGSLQIQENISKISDGGHKLLAKANLKIFKNNVLKLIEKTLENYDLSTSDIGNKIITIFGSKIFGIKALGQDFQELKSLAEPIIEKIVKQQGFNPEIKDQFGYPVVQWLGEFGADFLAKCIENMQTKPNVNLIDNNGKSAVHWYSSYKDPETVKILIKSGGNVNAQSTEKMQVTFNVHGISCTVQHELKMTAVHQLLLANNIKPNLPTLKVLLNKENKPPFDPSIKMVGDKTAADVLEEKKAAIVDYDVCHTALDEYTTWYNNGYSVASLGQAVEEFNLYE